MMKQKIITVRQDGKFTIFAVYIEQRDEIKAYALCSDDMSLHECCLDTQDMFKVALEMMKYLTKI